MSKRSRQARLSAEEALKRIIQLQDEDEDEDDLVNLNIEDESSSDDEVNQNMGDIDSASDQESNEPDEVADLSETDESDEETNQEESDKTNNSSASPAELVGKNGKVWKTEPPKSSGRRKEQDILREKLGIKGCDNVHCTMDAFNLFISDEIMDICVRYTNAYAKSVFDAYNENHPEEELKRWISVTLVEVRAFIGLLLLAGVFKSNKEQLDELWAVTTGRPIFRATMSLKRFQQILRYFRFDNRNTRKHRVENNKLAPIRDIWDMFVASLPKYYIPGSCLTVDEQLVPFRGRCPFRQYMASKPAKYGIKIWWNCDSETSFPLNGQVYLGKPADGERETNQGARVVKDLVSPWYRSGRNITMDNFFTSVPLAVELLHQNTTIVGTLRCNKAEIPAEMKKNPKRKIESSTFGFSEDLTLVSYVPKKNKSVICLSTLHHDDNVPEDENPKHKPEIILYYNSTKGGVDNLDHLVSLYTCKRKILRWPMSIFFCMLDVAAIAGLIIWTIKYPDLHNNNTKNRRQFLVELGNQLVKEHIYKRLDQPRALQKGARHGLLTLGYEVQAPPAVQKNPAKRRCHMCPRNKDRKTQTLCDKCMKNVCREHSANYTICSDCQ